MIEKFQKVILNKIYKNYTLKKGDILLSIVGTIGRTALVEKPDRIAFQRSVAILRVNNYHFNKYYLYLFETEKFFKKLLRNQVVSAQPGLYLGDLGRFDLAFPSNFKEQQKIGDFFSKLDRQIELEEQKLEKLEQQKKGYMQKIFSQQLRFKDENGNDYPDWEAYKLKDVANIVGGGTPNTKVNEYWNGDINWYSPIEIGSQIYIYESKKKISKLGLEKSSAKILPIGTILFTSRAGLGKTAILKIEGCTNQGFQSIIPKKNKLDTYFIYSQSYKLKRYAEIVGAGSTFTEVSGKQMEKMPIDLPILNEQIKIGEFFRNIDSLIEKQNNKIIKLNTLKKGFLQKMFI